MTETHPEEAHVTHDHPTVRQYVNVAIVLAVVTAAEVGIYYIPAIRSILVPLLLIFAVLKFALVVLWFMHLKFDSPMFRRLFVAGLGFAVVVFTIVLLTFFVRDTGAFTSGGGGG